MGTNIPPKTMPIMENKPEILIGSWNLCLGLPNKKDIVTQYLHDNNISICCLQETEVPQNYPENNLNCNGFLLELEQCENKMRSGIYISKGINYTRRYDLEKKGHHIVIIDVCVETKIRIINVYRSFRPYGMSPAKLFENQLKIIKKSLTCNSVVMGDFNLDARMEGIGSYNLKALLLNLTEFALENKLCQIINFSTWSRIINGTKKESLLDHVYVNNIASVKDVHYVEPVFGDHVLLMIKLQFRLETNEILKATRNWRAYNSDTMNMLINSTLIASGCDWPALGVQDHWNVLENCLINVVDYLAPLEYKSVVPKKLASSTPKRIKSLLNLRKRLLKNDRQRNNSLNTPRIKLLSKEIRTHYLNKKISMVRQAATGSNINLWKAVKIAKDLTAETIPINLTLGGANVVAGEAANSFAKFFHEKVTANVAKSKVVINNVYNGKCKLIVQNRNFMNTMSVKECMLTLNQKKCEGYDRIPVCCIYDARESLQVPMASLFDKIYNTCVVPEQWKISKIMPIFKKGCKNAIENYRPIANLCSASKIFEKLILKQIHYLESTNKLDLTGKQQHGFKKTKALPRRELSSNQLLHEL